MKNTMICPTCSSEMLYDYISYMHGTSEIKVKGYECSNINCSEIVYDKEAALNTKERMRNV